MEIEIIKFIQSFSSDFLDIFFQAITMLGEQMITVAVFAFVYWLCDKELGTYLGYSILTSLNINGIIKALFKMERPIGKEGIRSLREHTATGYSFPSGHTQGASTLLFGIAVWVRKNAVTVVMIIISVLVGISRLYLGVHYPKDVVVGLILGFIISYVTYVLYKNTKHKMLLFLITALLFLPFLYFDRTPDLLASYALFLGFIAGVAFERRFVKFSTKVNIIKKILRFAIGALLMIGIDYLFKNYLDSTELIVFIKYFAIAFFGVGLYPYLFKKLGF